MLFVTTIWQTHSKQQCDQQNRLRILIMFTNKDTRKTSVILFSCLHCFGKFLTLVNDSEHELLGFLTKGDSNNFSHPNAF